MSRSNLTRCPSSRRWPGSIIEQLKIIDPLTNPTSGQCFGRVDVVIPSLPGHGFQASRPRRLGPQRRARLTVLMQRLATDVVAQGGDWGNAVTGRWRCRHRRTGWYSHQHAGPLFQPT
jgi:hypothetical protein